MINWLNLLWIIPVTGSFGYILGAIMATSSIADDVINKTFFDRIYNEGDNDNGKRY